MTTQLEEKTRWSVRPPRIFSGALSQLRFCRRREFLIDEDVSNGRESIKIPAVSYKRNDKAPSDYHYVTRHIQCEPVYVDTSFKSMFMCKCQYDCADGGCYCSSAHKSGRSYDSKGRLAADYDVNAPEIIYECNAGCGCNRKGCKNMVIQDGLKCRIMLFRTSSRGWGVRTVETLERGTFVGIYSGELISAADSQKRHDDTYLFNLATTHIYHQSQAPPKHEEETEQTQEDNPAEASGLRQDQAGADDHHQQVITAVEEVTQPSVEQFVCDAKFYGNVTRFINHSCEANVIGIRSYTEHHDVRFPHIAFFTNKQVPANTELTLNYGDNYWLVKCKRDKVYCLCKKSSCRFSRKTFPETLRQHNRMKRTANGSDQ